MLAMLAPGSRVVTKGKKNATVERILGGGDYIVRTDEGIRYVVNERTLQSETASPSPSPVPSTPESPAQGPGVQQNLPLGEPE